MATVAVFNAQRSGGRHACTYQGVVERGVQRGQVQPEIGIQRLHQVDTRLGVELTFVPCAGEGLEQHHGLEGVVVDRGLVMPKQHAQARGQRLQYGVITHRKALRDTVQQQHTFDFAHIQQAQAQAHAIQRIIGGMGTPGLGQLGDDVGQLFTQAIGQGLLETAVELLGVFTQQKMGRPQVLPLSKTGLVVHQINQAVAHQSQIFGFVLGEIGQRLRNQHTCQAHRRVGRLWAWAFGG